MSGPIVRKYGFPNFEKIFGEKPLVHGKEAGEEEKKEPSAESPKENEARARADCRVETS